MNNNTYQFSHQTKIEVAPVKWFEHINSALDAVESWPPAYIKSCVSKRNELGFKGIAKDSQKLSVSIFGENHR